MTFVNFYEQKLCLLPMSIASCNEMLAVLWPQRHIHFSSMSVPISCRASANDKTGFGHYNHKLPTSCSAVVQMH
jgi:hypothetical protein